MKYISNVMYFLYFYNCYSCHIQGSENALSHFFQYLVVVFNNKSIFRIGPYTLNWTNDSPLQKVIECIMTLTIIY